MATAIGGTPPYHFSLGSLANGAPPLGTVLDLNGNLSGTPTIAGLYSFEVCVTDVTGAENCGTATVTVQYPSIRCEARAAVSL